MSAEKLRLFQTKWCSADYPPDVVSESALLKAGEQLAWQVPEDYSQAVLEVGLPQPTIALLNTIVDNELDVFDLSEFLNPEAIVERTIGWREIGLPEHLVAFASDSSGNLFAFCKESPSKPSEVWIWDHDFNEVEKLASSFGQWLDSYLAI
ncbi:MAG: SMI1/KNR4 family protein [Pseudomonadota bacterium]